MELGQKLEEVKQSNEEQLVEIKALRKNKGNPMATAMQKQMIAALREENKMLQDQVYGVRAQASN